MSLDAVLAEVRNLALLLGGDQLDGKRQADAFPAILLVSKDLGCALIPHAAVIGKRIADRCVEVLLVYE